MLEPLPDIRPPRRPASRLARDLPARAALDWLAAGWSDFRAAPWQSLAYGGFLVALSYALLWALAASGLLYLALPAISGFLIVGPFLAIGLYALSRRRAQGKTTTLRHMLLVRPAAGAQLAYAGQRGGIANAISFFRAGNRSMRMPPTLPRPKGFRFSREIISDAVRAFRRVALRTADVEYLRAARGVVVSRQSIRQRADRFGAHFTGCIRRDRPASADKWHPGEVVHFLEAVSSPRSSSPTTAIFGLRRKTPRPTGHSPPSPDARDQGRRGR